MNRVDLSREENRNIAGLTGKSASSPGDAKWKVEMEGA